MEIIVEDCGDTVYIEPNLNFWQKFKKWFGGDEIIPTGFFKVNETNKQEDKNNEKSKTERVSGESESKEEIAKKENLEQESRENNIESSKRGIRKEEKDKTENLEQEDRKDDSESREKVLTFYDLKKKNKFDTDKYEIVETNGRRMAVAIAPSGARSCRFIKK